MYMNNIIALLVSVPYINSAYSSFAEVSCYCTVEGDENDSRYVGENCSLCYEGSGRVPCTGFVIIFE